MQFVDTVVAEDTGKSPDNNLVEALQRLPGVQVTDYSRGNITGVTIRGLPAEPAGLSQKAVAGGGVLND